MSEEVEYEKTFDGFAKFSILRQSTGAKVMPVSLSAVTSVALKTLKFQNQTQTKLFFIEVSLCSTGSCCKKNQSGDINSA